MNISILILSLFCFLFLAACSTLVLRLVSKKFPRVWKLNKWFLGISFCLSIALIPIYLTLNYFHSMPSAAFHRAFGIGPSADITELKASVVRPSDEEITDLEFVTSGEKFKELSAKCFFEIPETVAKESYFYPKNFNDRPGTQYFMRLDERLHNNVPVECDNSLPNSIILYEKESGRVYVHTKTIHLW